MEQNNKPLNQEKSCQHLVTTLSFAEEKNPCKMQRENQAQRNLIDFTDTPQWQ